MSENSEPSVIVKSKDEWIRQLHDALDLIKKKNGGEMPGTLGDGYNLDYQAFASLVEAMCALAPFTGIMPSEEVRRVAGIKLDAIIVRAVEIGANDG